MKKIFYSLFLISSISCIVPSFSGINTEVYGVEAHGSCAGCGAQIPYGGWGYCSEECYKKVNGE